MNPIAWLNAHAPGFQALSENERQAIMQFSLLWSLFEANALNTRGSANAILALVQRWDDQGRLNAADFADHLAYFRHRYFADGAFTQHFQGLHLRANDNRETVEAVLRGEDEGPANCVGALLIIVLRFRNNLFHGIKWAHKLRGQLQNFKHANALLMKALEVNGI